MVGDLPGGVGRWGGGGPRAPLTSGHSLGGLLNRGGGLLGEEEGRTPRGGGGLLQESYRVFAYKGGSRRPASASFDCLHSNQLDDGRKESTYGSAVQARLDNTTDRDRRHSRPMVGTFLVRMM